MCDVSLRLKRRVVQLSSVVTCKRGVWRQNEIICNKFKTGERMNTPMSTARGRVLQFSEKERLEDETVTLESSLLQLIDDNRRSSFELREKTERFRKEAIRHAAKTADLLVKAVNGGVEECFLNEKRIEAEIRSLAVTVARFGKQTDQWLAATHAVNSAIKEIGDFENWMKTMEFDCKKITAAIRNIHEDH